MAKQTIDNTAPDADNLPDGADIINDNFDELYDPDYGINAVRDYGADNTGSTDATTAIQNAFDAADALVQGSTTGPPVYIPAGVYKISDTLTVGDHSIIGAGPMATHLKWYGDTTGPAMDMTSPRRAYFKGFRWIEGDETPACWIDAQQTNPDSIDWGFWLDDVYLHDWNATTGTCAMKIGRCINLHMSRMRFGSGKGYVIDMDCTQVQGSVYLTDWTIDYSVNATVMDGFLDVKVDNSVSATGTTIHIANARVESTVAFGGDDRFINIYSDPANDIGLMPITIFLNNVNVQVSGSALTLVHQETTSSTAGSHVTILNMPHTGIGTLAGGNWSSDSYPPPNVPSGRIQFLQWGRTNSGAAATARGIAHMAPLHVPGRLTIPTVQYSSPLGSATEGADIRFNTVTKELECYDGAGWVGVTLS